MSLLVVLIYIVTCFLINDFDLERTDLHHNMFGKPLIFVIMSLFSCASVVFLSMQFSFPKFITLFGQNSLALYSLEGLAAIILGKLLSITNISSFGEMVPNIYSVVFVLSICFFCLLMSKLITKFCPFVLGKSAKNKK